MDVFVTISIRLEITQEKGNLLVEMVGECEGEYNKLALSVGTQRVDRTARECGGKKSDKTKEVGPQQFYRAFIFPDKESKNRFLEILTNDQ